MQQWLKADLARIPALEKFSLWVKQWHEHQLLLVDEQLVHAESLALHCEADFFGGGLLGFIGIVVGLLRLAVSGWRAVFGKSRRRQLQSRGTYRETG
jgi:hypothetical protein